MTERGLDVVLFGATGFTGGLVAEYLAGVAAKRPLRWGLAGRNRSKLEAVRAKLPLPAGSNGAPELIVVDASDANGLSAMAQRTRVVITTVGPYMHYGEPLVRACAELGTDYVDLTGEPEFVDLCRERYHAQAERSRAKIVNACGFDSIPHDLGCYFTLQALRARMSAAELESAAITIEGVVRSNGTFSGGTLQSALEIMSNAPARARKKRNAPPPIGPRKIAQLPMRPGYRPELGMWLVPMPTIDPEIIVHSAELLPEYGPDFKYGHYLGVKNALQVAGVIAGVGTIVALAQIPPAKALLKKIKDPGEGPSEAKRAKSYFKVGFTADGAGHRVRCEVSGGDPGYTETSKMLAESALCLAFDRARLPQHYGVVPSAAALGNPLIERLRDAGIVFREL
ncbi:MAG TPA: saccharopine dehydrogenase NADP-binding domain-containing protein [Polyangiales bacterium]|nr:saccharopine dehydrogenase NADP-binding domain-containing protein [Polyangiales bacterium]